MTARVLCFGSYPVLLETRRLILVQHYAVATATSIEQFEFLLANSGSDLVVLCHSLSAEECKHACSLVRKHSVCLQVLGIVGPSRSPHTAECDRQLITLGNPSSLLEAVEAMLEHVWRSSGG